MPTEKPMVYIAEVVFFEDNPVDGRKRVAVCSTLEGAISALRKDDDREPELVATETTSALGSESARTWAVHEPDEEPSDFGCLWITAERVTA